MKWRLIFNLSSFAFVMAIVTVFWIPSNIEHFCCPVIFIICAYIIAKNVSGNYFLYGFLLSMVNSIWVTSAHIIFYTTYMGNHPDMQQLNAQMPLHEHPRLMMLTSGPIIGSIFGLIQGLFAFIAGKIVKKQTA